MSHTPLCEVQKIQSDQEENIMRNEGTTDRSIRIILGLGVLSLTFIGPQTPWGYAGLVPLLTGAVGFCPLYAIFKINTCGLKNSA